MSKETTVTPQDMEYAAQRLRQSNSFARGEAHRTFSREDEVTDNHDGQFQDRISQEQKLDPVAAMHRFNNPPKRSTPVG